jgi:hypothetical protein
MNRVNYNERYDAEETFLSCRERATNFRFPTLACSLHIHIYPWPRSLEIMGQSHTAQMKRK